LEECLGQSLLFAASAAGALFFAFAVLAATAAIALGGSTRNEGHGDTGRQKKKEFFHSVMGVFDAPRCGAVHQNATFKTRKGSKNSLLQMNCSKSD
jgi:hypothetical protein